jgi:hypothetical protein
MAATKTKSTTLWNELLTAFDRALLAGLGAVTGVLSASSLSDGKAFVAAGIASGTAALVSLGNSVRNLQNGTVNESTTATQTTATS